jgi:hypothetical protein
MKKLISVIIFIFLFVCCKAQAVGGDYIKGRIVIFNNTHTNISVLLGDSIRLDTFKLKENDNWFKFDYNPIIKIQTNTYIVTYQLLTGNQYIVFWNTKKNIWDLKKKIVQ